MHAICIAVNNAQNQGGGPVGDTLLNPGVKDDNARYEEGRP